MDEILKKIDAESELYRPVPKNSSSYCQGEYKGYVDGLQKAKEFILSQQKKPCEYMLIDDNINTWECNECGNMWILNAGTPKDNNMNFCPNCGREVIN